MKAFYLVFGILTQLFLTGCEKIGGLGDIVMDSGIDFLCEDELKNDLFSKSSTNTLNTDNIRIYYVNGNQKINVFDYDRDFQRNYKIYEFSTGNVMRLFPNDSLENGYSTTLIEWNLTDTDTIKCAIKKTSTTLITDSVWYNNKLEYPTNNEYKPKRMFKIIK